MQLIGGMIAGDPTTAYLQSRERVKGLELGDQDVALKRQQVTAGNDALAQGNVFTNWINSGGFQDLMGPGMVTGPGASAPARPGSMRSTGDIVPADPTRPPPGVEYEDQPVGPGGPDYTFGAAAQPQQTAQMVDPMEVQRRRGLALLQSAMTQQPGTPAMAFQPPAQAPVPRPMQATPAGPGAQPVPLAQPPSSPAAPTAPPAQPSMVVPRPAQPAGGPQQAGPSMVTRPPVQAAPRPAQPQQPGPQQQQMPPWMDPMRVFQSIAKANPGADPNTIMGATERVMKMLGASAEARAMSKMYGGGAGYGGALKMAMMAYMQNNPGATAEEAYAAVSGERARATAEAPMFPRAQQRTLNSFMTPHGNTAGGNLVAVNTAVDHLKTMEDLGKKLGNNNIRMINSIAQRIAEATGQEAPTNFDTARIFIANEINKVLVASGTGTGEERQELANRFQRINSPEQLKGAITTARKLLAGRLKSLEQAWGAARLDDVTGIKFNDFLRPETSKYFSVDIKPKGQATSKDTSPTKVEGDLPEGVTSIEVVE